MARYLLLIGNSKYDDKKYLNLPFVENDIEELNNILSEYGEFATISQNLNTEKIEMEMFLEKYRDILTIKDDLLLYFSGHAEVDKRTNKLVFIFKDTKADYVSSTSVSSDYLSDFIKFNNAKSKVFILDCCYSGAFIDRFAMSRSFAESEEELIKAEEQFLVNSKGTYGITSSRRSQTSRGSEYLSVFTKCIIDGLKTGKADYSNRGRISIDDLWKYINSSIKSKNQIPRKFDDREGEFFVSKNPVYKKKEELSLFEEMERKIPREKRERKEKENDEDKTIDKLSGKKEQLLNFKVGDFIQFGRYFNEPILWKYEKKGEYGFLLVSVYILCLKPFDAAEKAFNRTGDHFIEEYGSNLWKDSNIREWLNSERVQVKYTTQPPIKEAVFYNDYAKESGFLYNFTNQEIEKIKTFEHDGMKDRIFLLSKNFLESLYPEKVQRIKCLTEKAVKNSNYKDPYLIPNSEYCYLLRTPSSSSLNYYVYGVGIIGGFDDNNYAYSGCCGIVPALFIDFNIVASGGNGSQNAPYIIS